MAMETLDADAASSLVRDLRSRFMQGVSRPIKWREQQILGFKKFLENHAGAISEALAQDLGRSKFETEFSEVSGLKLCIKKTLKRLPKWMKPEKVNAGLIAFPAKCEVVPEPLGVVLIMGAWNVPLVTHLEPFIGAIAAGNAIVVKLSEVCLATSSLIAKTLPQYLDESLIQFVEGGPAVAEVLLQQKWDKIFFTGSIPVGRLVMAAAARYLTPVTLELGGKSPTIVDATANLRVAAKRIVMAKFGFNAGQVCVAPDYVLVEDVVAAQLVDYMIKTIKEFFGDDPQKSEDMARIINERHFDRVLSLIKDSGISSESVVFGGVSDRESRYISPTIVCDAPWESKLMTEEIFGPILPVQKVRTMDEAVEIVNSRPKPLALYCFTEDKGFAQRIIDRTSTGGAVINDCLMQMTIDDLPFGGVGESGMGAYHGKHTFDSFTHMKSVCRTTTSSFADPFFRYPPYSAQKMGILMSLLSGSVFMAFLSIVGLRRYK